MFSKILCSALAVVLSSTAGADVITITADRDSTIFSEDVNSANGSGEHIVTGQNSNGQTRRAFIRFDIASSIPPGSVISAVQLQLHMSRTVAGGESVSLHYVTTDWGEGPSNPAGQEGSGTAPHDNDCTWNYTFYDTANPPPSPAWTTPGGDYVPSASATTSVSGIATYTWGSTIDMVADAQAWLDGPTSNFGWAIIGNESTSRTAKRFDSRTNPTISERPQLTITFTPPPGSGACCLPIGSCVVLLPTDCANQGGVFQGAGTSCTPNPCPQPDGACCFNNTSCTEISETDCDNQGGTWQGPLTTCANTDCPLVLEQFVDAMPIPPIATPTTGTVGGTATYDIDIVQTNQQLHRDLPPTTVWTYEGVFPGPTIVARENFPVTVNFHNELRDEFNNYRTDHILDVDLCPHGAEDVPKVVVHLHGGHVPADVDGHPEETVLPGESFSYTYPNTNQESALIWYHDHALGITRLNVYAGLAAGYIVRDTNEDSLTLPTGEFEVPLIIQDRTLNADGSLSYPSTIQDNFFGEHMLVNGMVWPHFDVKRAKYRFRLLNGCNARTLSLAFNNGHSFEVISSDGGFLDLPVIRTSITLAPAERADLLVDFSALAPGTEIIMTNNAAAPYPFGDPANNLPEVMKFIVSADTGPTPATPAVLNSIEQLQESDAVLSRNFVLRKAPAQHAGAGCPPLLWLINDLAWDDITEKPFLGDTEIWEFDNISGMMHPMHMHLVFFQVLDRQALSPLGNPIGIPSGPDVIEAGWKDTVRVGPSERVRVIARFEDYTGLFPYHCHILDHEDHEMMRQFLVREKCLGDANNDGVVNVNDISYVLFRLGDPCPVRWCDGDVDGDTDVNVNDISYVLFRLNIPC